MLINGMSGSTTDLLTKIVCLGVSAGLPRTNSKILPSQERSDGAGFAGETEQNLGRNAMMSWTRVWSPQLITETRDCFLAFGDEPRSGER